MSARIVFVSPSASAAAIGRVLADHYGEVEGLGPVEDSDTAMRYLETRADGFVEASFDDEEDPDTGLLALVGILREAGADHFGVTPSYEERSRGVRVEGRILAGLAGTVLEKTMPWRAGEPGLDIGTLVAADVNEEDRAEIVRRFLDPRRSPDPLARP